MPAYRSDSVERGAVVIGKQLIILSAPTHQLFVAALFYNTPDFQHQNPVDSFDGRKVVRYEHDSFIVGLRQDIIVERFFRDRIERRGWLIQYPDVRV